MKLDFNKLLKVILKSEDLEPYCFSGNCFSTAYALHELCPESKIVVSFNKRIFKENGRFIGHCGIRVNGIIIDGEGVIEEEDFLAWGMLDEHDLSYIESTSITAKEWSIEAYEASIIEVEPHDIMSAVDLDIVEEVKNIILNKK